MRDEGGREEGTAGGLWVTLVTPRHPDTLTPRHTLQQAVHANRAGADWLAWLVLACHSCACAASPVRRLMVVPVCATVLCVTALGGGGCGGTAG